MTISRDLMLAILSMDSYNRGYSVGVNLRGNTASIGNATIGADSAVLTNSSGARLGITVPIY
jgi:hypothetical protein